MNNIIVSACMMVKNEEDLLPGCFESIKGMVDEIILVDTGSTDKTIKIAKSFGAKIYHHPWENNFSKHRNQTIEYASGDWLLIIDADERLIPNRGVNKAQLIHTLSKIPPSNNALMLAVRDIDPEGEVVTEYMSARLFRNTPDFHYEGIVHNQPIFKGETINIKGLSLNHHGYHLSRAKMAKKHERTGNLLLERIQKNPNDEAAYFYLANHYSFVPQGIPSSPEKVIEYGEKCVQLLDPDPNRWSPAYLGLFRTVGESYDFLGDREKAAEWALKGLEVISDDPDLHFLMCRISMARGNYRGALNHSLSYLNSLEKYQKEPQLAQGRLLSSVGPDFEMSTHYRILTAYLGMGEKTKAEGKWPVVKDFVISNDQLKVEYLWNLAAAGDTHRLMDRTLLFTASSPKDMAIIVPLIDHAIAAEALPQTLEALLGKLPGGEKSTEAVCQIAEHLVKRGAYPQAITILKPYYQGGAPHDDIIKFLAFSYEMTGDNDRARKIYNAHMNDEGIEPDFIINAINYYKKVNDEKALHTAVSTLMRKQTHLDLDDGLLLFLVEYYWTYAMHDDFLSATAELLPRHLQQLPKKFQDNIEIAAGYRRLSIYLLEAKKPKLGIQALHIAWAITKNPSYLSLLGNLFFDADQTETALQYYQEALNRNHITIGILDRMQDAYLKLGNDSGAAICRKLKQKLSSALTP